MSSAKFPIHRDLLGFDFGQSKVDQPLVNKLATMTFTDAAQNLVLVSGTGTGKTYLATALGSLASSITVNDSASSLPLN